MTDITGLPVLLIIVLVSGSVLLIVVEDKGAKLTVLSNKGDIEEASVGKVEGTLVVDVVVESLNVLLDRGVTKDSAVIG